MSIIITPAYTLTFHDKYMNYLATCTIRLHIKSACTSNLDNCTILAYASKFKYKYKYASTLSRIQDIYVSMIVWKQVEWKLSNMFRIKCRHLLNDDAL
jgi:hypothetical protein